jgi:hypothetical protein
MTPLAGALQLSCLGDQDCSAVLLCLEGCLSMEVPHSVLWLGAAISACLSSCFCCAVTAVCCAVTAVAMLQLSNGRPSVEQQPEILQ